MLNFVAIDFETANVNPASACAIGMVKVVDGRIVEKRYRLINPHMYFNTAFTKNVHGISAADVKTAPTFDIAWNALSEMLDGAQFLVAHNATFDRRVLQHCCKRYGVSFPNLRFLCTLKISHQCWTLPCYALQSVCEHLNIELQHHHALSDAMGCANILLEAASKMSFDKNLSQKHS